MLINSCNAVGVCFSWVGEGDFFAFQDDLTLIRCMDTGNYFDKSRLSGSVFAHQCMNFAFLQLKLYMIQRNDSGKALDDVL